MFFVVEGVGVEPAADEARFGDIFENTRNNIANYA